MVCSVCKVIVLSRRGRRAEGRRAGDASVDAGARADGPADRPVPRGLTVGGHVRACARLLLERQAALAPHVRSRRQPRHHTGMTTLVLLPRHKLTDRGAAVRPVPGGLMRGSD